MWCACLRDAPREGLDVGLSVRSGRVHREVQCYATKARNAMRPTRRQKSMIDCETKTDACVCVCVWRDSTKWARIRRDAKVLRVCVSLSGVLFIQNKHARIFRDKFFFPPNACAGGRESVWGGTLSFSAYPPVRPRQGCGQKKEEILLSYARAQQRRGVWVFGVS